MRRTLLRLLVVYDVVEIKQKRGIDQHYYLDEEE
jgi:hypothetical protein